MDEDKNRLKIEWASPEALTIPDYNARAHTEDQVNSLVDAIKEFGFRSPVIIDKGGVVIAGEGRLLAAMQMGMDSVPVVRAHHLTEPEAREFAIADNRVYEMGSWDEEAADRILQEVLNSAPQAGPSATDLVPASDGSEPAPEGSVPSGATGLYGSHQSWDSLARAVGIDTPGGSDEEDSGSSAPGAASAERAKKTKKTPIMCIHCGIPFEVEI